MRIAPLFRVSTERQRDEGASMQAQERAYFEQAEKEGWETIGPFRGAESATQARVLKLLRDHGPLSRVELADRLGLSRTTMAVEVGRLVEQELAAEVGPAASRGGRRSTLVDLSPSVRFVGVAIGATGMTVAVTDGRLAVLGQAHRDVEVRQGPEHALVEHEAVS